MASNDPLSFSLIHNVLPHCIMVGLWWHEYKMAKGWYITSELGYKNTLQFPFSAFFVFSLPPLSVCLFPSLWRKQVPCCLVKESRSLPAMKDLNLRVDPPAPIKSSDDAALPNILTANSWEILDKTTQIFDMQKVR